jgi:hypothetical protein
MAIIHTEKWKNRGFGDTINTITTASGIKKVVKVVSEAIGEDCGCEERREALNNPDLLVNKIFYKNKN